MTEMWPVLEGQHRAETAYAQALTTTSPPSVDIVPSLQDEQRLTYPSTPSILGGLIGAKYGLSENRAPTKSHGSSLFSSLKL